MSRSKTLAQPVPSLEQRRRRIESEPLPPNIAALIDEAANAAGDRMAWNFFESGETITYADLRRRVQGLARGLAAIGVRKGTHVAVMLPNVAAFPLTWLAIGTLGYHYFGNVGWVDGLLNAAMILTGMGPVDKMESTAGKLFATFYALYSGIAFLTMIAVIIAPIYHRFLHRFHLASEEEDKPEEAPKDVPPAVE